MTTTNVGKESPEHFAFEPVEPTPANNENQITKPVGGQTEEPDCMAGCGEDPTSTEATPAE